MNEQAPGNPEPRHLFLSYASADLARTETVAGALAGAGIRVWVDRGDIPGGANYGPLIVAAIRESAALLLCCSNAAFASRNVRQEVALAWKYERPIIPFRLELVEPPDDLAYWLEAAQWIDGFDRPPDRWVPEVVGALDRLTMRPGPSQSQPASVPGAVIHLPHPLTTLVGRQQEVADLSALLTSHRVVTLTGPGGTGKTRLAIAIAHAVLPQFPAGAVFVDLSAVTDPALVHAAIVDALGFQPSPGTTLADTLVRGIAAKRLVLVLDNFEQVIGAAGQVDALVRACPHLAILVTSRLSLQVPGEQVVPVTPLAVPARRPSYTLADVATLPAIQLFVERARDVRPEFRLTDANTAAIAAICQRVDGLPLAIELAAVRVRILSPTKLLDRLGSALTLLTGGRQGGPERQRTLRDTIAWSYDLLTPDEQATFRRCAVFVDGFTLDAATAVCAHEKEFETLDLVASLVDKSLLRRSPVDQGEPRFTMLETIREFGNDRLVAAGESEATRQRHAEWYRQWSAQLGQMRGRILFGSIRDIQDMDADYANLRAAMTWFAEEGKVPAGTLGIATALGGFWILRGHLDDGQHWLERALAQDDGSTPLVRTRALLWLGMLLGTHGVKERGDALVQESLAVAQENHDELGVACALNCRGFGMVHGQGPSEVIEELANQSLAIFTTLAVPWGVQFARGLLVQVAMRRGELEKARDLLEQLNEEQQRSTGDDYWTALAHHGLAVILTSQGNRPRARALFVDALKRFDGLGDLGKVAWCLEAVARASDPEQGERAGRLLGAAHALRMQIAVPLLESERPGYDEIVAAVRDAIGALAFERAWQAGTMLPKEAAIAEAASLVLSSDIIQ